jgi:hypothetical protein
MVTTVRARFDGEVLRPEEPLDLEANETYILTIRADQGDEHPDDVDPAADDPLTKIERMAVDMGVDDLSANHTWYAHGRRTGFPKDA